MDSKYPRVVLFVSPATIAKNVAIDQSVSVPTARADLGKLMEAGILVPIDVTVRPIIYYSPEILSITHRSYGSISD